jgi:hypothetical protein
MTSRRWLVGMALVLATACSPDATEQVSSNCDRAMREAAAETDPTAANPLIVDTLSACSTADEWLAGLREHPGAMGLTERAEFSDERLRAPCYGNEATPVCRDAAEGGRLP